VPELPEVESARAVIERSALRRRIVDVDDHDTYECRPHQPGEIREALVGRQLTVAHRRGKLMWCELNKRGPLLALHLGMAGRIFVSRGKKTDVGGDYVRTKSNNHKPEWDRFTITFADGGTLRLFDKRRLGRVYLDPDLDALGPDAGEVGVRDFRAIVGRGTAPVKARLLDQSAVAGVGNLLADQTLWQARIDPRRPSGELTADELTTLHRELRKAIRAAIKHGGVHTGEVIPYRHREAHCPRCGAEMQRATVGSRTTWWCPREQQ
jgi:formamidopyrimidine-DNA glycosylase